MAPQGEKSDTRDDGPWWLRHVISGTFAVFGGGVMVDSLVTKWWPGLAAGAVVLLHFGRAASGARRTETSAGPAGITEKTDYALKEKGTGAPAYQANYELEEPAPEATPERPDSH